MKRLVVLALLVTALPASASTARILAYQDAWPTWSPDGDTLAFTRIHVPGNLMELYVADTKTHRVTKVAQNTFQLLPSWSPDGTKLAYQAGGAVYVTDVHGVRRRVGPVARRPTAT